MQAIKAEKFLPYLNDGAKNTLIQFLLPKIQPRNLPTIHEVKADHIDDLHCASAFGSEMFYGDLPKNSLDDTDLGKSFNGIITSGNKEVVRSAMKFLFLMAASAQEDLKDMQSHQQQFQNSTESWQSSIYEQMTGCKSRVIEHLKNAIKVINKKLLEYWEQTQELIDDLKSFALDICGLKLSDIGL